MKSIYIRKMRYDEAELKLDREIQTAFSEGIQEVEIVHGIGSGKLKNLVINYVEKNSFLKLRGDLNIGKINPGSTVVEILTSQHIKKYFK